jgi:hypothetical protein
MPPQQSDYTEDRRVWSNGSSRLNCLVRVDADRGLMRRCVYLFVEAGRCCF